MMNQLCTRVLMDALILRELELYQFGEKWNKNSQ